MNSHEAGPSSGPGRPGVLVLACAPAVREGLRALLDGEGFRAQAAGSAAEALPQVLTHQPDVAMVDIRLGDSTAVEFCRAARSLLPPLQFLLLTSYQDHLSVLQAVLADASGLVLRQLRSDILVSAVRRAAGGDSLINATVRSEIIQGLSAATTADGQPWTFMPSPLNLTHTERDLLALAAHGLDDESISQDLGARLGEVPELLRTALAKLGIEPLNRTPGP
jgi:DNA-binding NarL/FixJ family response regulator